MIAVVDYCKGNLKSVERGIAYVGGSAQITDDPADIARADAIVLPGVGSFADAATTMENLGQMEVIRERVLAGVPFLGICLGLHLMFETGTEGAPDAGASDETIVSGLNLIPGTAHKMPSIDKAGNRSKVPHVGWNSIENIAPDCALLKGIDEGEYFYFTHSYLAPESACTCATTEHSTQFPSVVQYGETAFGVQFHPEKSSDAGLALLKNFLDVSQG